MPANARALLATGTAGSRLVNVLTNTLQHHTIVIGDIQTITDPVHAQAIDITAVDGQPIDPSNVAARDLITEIAALDPTSRPNEIGTPWPIQSQGFFTDPTHQNRLHLAFTSQADYQPTTPASSNATPNAGAAAAAAAQAGPTPADPAAAGAAQAAQQAMQAPAPAATPVGGVAPSAPASPGAGGAGVAPAAGLAPAVAPAIAHQIAGGGAAAALAYARSMIGKLPEIGGNNIGPALDRLEADYGYHAEPWCGIFVGHALQAAGLEVPRSVASVASILDMARSGDGPFEKGIVPVSSIRPGDLVTFGGTEHVAMVRSVDAQGIHTIAGNTSQENVSETTYSPSEVTGVVRPKYGPGPADARVIAAIAPAPAVAPDAATPGGAEVSANAEAALAAENLQARGAPPPAVPSPSAAAEFRALEPKHAPSARATVQFMAAVQPPPRSPAAPSAAPNLGAPGQNPLGGAGGEPAAPPTPPPDVPATRGQPPGIGAAQVADVATGTSAYPGDGAPKPAIARWMADEAQRHGLPGELPVMAALVESDLHNDAGGDRDSVGYFQMRTSIWDNGPYAGYTHNPNLQLKWFLDQAVALKNDRLKTDPGFGRLPSQFGNWIADIERPAAVYRGRYQLRFDEARQLLGRG